MKIKVGDLVMVMRGKSRGKTGKVLKIDKTANRVLVEKVNIIVKHMKKRPGQAGERIEKEGYVHASNVMIVCPSTKKPTRVGYKKDDKGKKFRITKKGNAKLDEKVVNK